jgi:hypothetical protein
MQIDRLDISLKGERATEANVASRSVRFYEWARKRHDDADRARRQMPLRPPETYARTNVRFVHSSPLPPKHTDAAIGAVTRDGW